MTPPLAFSTRKKPYCQGSAGLPAALRSRSSHCGDTAPLTYSPRNPSANGNPVRRANCSGCSNNASSWSGDQATSWSRSVSGDVVARVITGLVDIALVLLVVVDADLGRVVAEPRPPLE